MSCGLCVVGSDIPEISETQIIDGIDGHIFREGDAIALSITLEKLLEERNNLVKLGAEARKKL
jgi:glycosyltransferase involved in cell wall biosynthesis